MKKLLMGAALGIAGVAAAAPAEAQVNWRQHNQQQRIYRGIQSGELTRREFYGLERNQARIARMEHRLRASGNRLTLRERVRLDRRQDRASVRIYRQKHDRQDR